ncbi:unnamed protein product [Brassica napus]|uniref:(rape) hypothetical protein n=1 Tax=Brassica napus TaxID=3708 RepID=A0A816MPZ9_BRANA|nr:unnamed protein product [Brassica napus]
MASSDLRPPPKRLRTPMLSEKVPFERLIRDAIAMKRHGEWRVSSLLSPILATRHLKPSVRWVSSSYRRDMALWQMFGWSEGHLNEALFCFDLVTGTVRRDGLAHNDFSFHQILAGELKDRVTNKMHFILNDRDEYFGTKVVSCVSDELDEAVFVAFDMEMEKLANIQAAEAAQILVKISYILPYASN